MTRANAEVAKVFSASIGPVGNARGGEVCPGYPGLVVAEASHAR